MRIVDCVRATVPMALVAVAWPTAEAQLVVANDTTANADCSLNYNDPDCWSGGEVPNNGGDAYRVVIDDPTALNVNQIATVSSLWIASGSSFTLPNARQYFIQGDTGSGVDGEVLINGLLDLQSTGSFTALRFTDGVSTITRDTAPAAGNFSLLSSNNPSNALLGNGAGSTLSVAKQAVSFTGTWNGFGAVNISDSTVQPNEGGKLILENLGEVTVDDTRFSALGDRTLRLANALWVASGDSSVTAESGGSVEVANITSSNLRYISLSGEVKFLNSELIDAQLSADAFGKFDFDFTNELREAALDSVLTLEGEAVATFANGSTTTLGAGVELFADTLAEVRMGSNGSPTIVKHEGDGSLGITYISPGYSGFSSQIRFTPDEANGWEGTGIDPSVEIIGIRKTGSGNVFNFSNIRYEDSFVENNEDTQFSYFNNLSLELSNTTFQATGPNGGIRVVDTDLEGIAAATIRAVAGGEFLGQRGSFSNFFGLADASSRFGFRDSTVQNAVLETEGAGVISTVNTTLQNTSISGNLEGGGDLVIDGVGNSFDTLSQAPGFSLRLQYANGAEQRGDVAFDPLRNDNQLSSVDGILKANGRISGSFTATSGIALGPRGRIAATGIVLLGAPGTTVDGEVGVDGGELRVNTDIGGAGQWLIRDGTFNVLNGTSVEGDALEVDTATLILQGGGLLFNDVTLDVDSEIVLSSTLAANRLSIGLVDESAWDLSTTTVVEMTGGAGATIGDWSDWGVLEVAGGDLGDDPLGFSDNFEIPTLSVAAGANFYLADLLDNGNRGGSGGEAEALYVDRLIFQDSSGRLNLNGLNLYFNELVGAESQIINQVVPLPPLVLKDGFESQP